jgi:hypothetical protein
VGLFGKHFTESATEDSEVLGGYEHLATVDRAPTGDDSIGVWPLVEANIVSPVAGQHVELVERAFVEQVVDPLAGEHLALVLLALNGPF